jgi:hypothetical protein
MGLREEQLYVTVKNFGVGDMTVPGWVKLYYGDPTVSNRADDPYLVLFDSLMVSPIPVGDSVELGPIPFNPPAANSFGEPHWTVFALVESPESELETGLIFDDLHVAAKNVWHSVGDAMIPQTVHFYARNPGYDTAKVYLSLDTSLLPPSWVVEMAPAAEETLLVPPMGSVPVELSVTAFTVDTGMVLIYENYCHKNTEPCTHCLDTCGGCYGEIGGAAFTVVATGVGVDEHGLIEVKGQIGLLQVHPNPFTGKTEISFAMSGRADVDVTIFDPSGRRVRTLHKGLLETGDVRLTWDGRDEAGHSVRPGHYFVLVVASDRTTARKITLLK